MSIVYVMKEVEVVLPALPARPGTQQEKLHKQNQKKKKKKKKRRKQKGAKEKGGTQQAAGATTTTKFLIRELMAPGSYGLYLWPSAHLLTEFLARNEWVVAGRTVLELGCGCALPGLVALALGAKQVVLTDTGCPRSVLENVLTICALNGVTVECGGSPSTGKQTSTTPDQVVKLAAGEARRRVHVLPSHAPVHVLPLEWGQFSSRALDLAAGRDTSIGLVEVLLGSDVFYDPSMYEDLLATLTLFRKPLLTVYHHRSEEDRHDLAFLVGSWGMTLQTVHLFPDETDFPCLAGVQAQFEILWIFSDEFPPPRRSNSSLSASTAAGT
eukprot:g2197.t1